MDFSVYSVDQIVNSLYLRIRHTALLVLLATICIRTIRANHASSVQATILTLYYASLVNLDVLLASTHQAVKPVRVMLRSTFGFKDQTVSLALIRVCTRILSTEDATHAVATASPALVQL